MASLAVLAAFVFLPAQGLATSDSDREPGTAGGGGWFEYDGKRITFGFNVDKDDPSENSLVFQGRNRDFNVHTLEITKVWFKPCKNGGYPSVHMKGTALVNNTDVYRFHFKATDKGTGIYDAAWMKLWPTTHHDGEEGGDEHGDDCSCSEHSDSGDGVDSCDGGSGCQGGACSGGGEDGGCSHDDGGGCSGGGESGHGRMVKWVTHSLGGGNIWVVMPEGSPCDCGGDH
ncbi:MAG: hypothetical protein MUC90_00930 [Thermoplasmata archaeon]|nr:hypothetical protein [Thermoplasmata archaeon]